MYDEIQERAYTLGEEMGKAAASWVFDGNTTRETYARVLKGVEDCDPEIMDMYRVPDLSGEWADEMTPQRLANELGISYADDDAVAVACEHWEYGVSDGFWHEVERVARLQLED